MHISLQERPAIRLHNDDNVAIALVPLSSGRKVLDVVTTSMIGAGHKIALCDVAVGHAIRRYGQIIGFATQHIRAGDHVHSHNLSVASMELDYAVASDIRPITSAPEQRTFNGYMRSNGSAGTRNTVAVIATVNCASHTVRKIVERAKRELWPSYPNVTDIIVLSHKHGCATRDGSPELGMLQRTLAGFAHNPNVAGYLFIGLGCETNQFESLFNAHRAQFGAMNLPAYLAIQDEGASLLRLKQASRRLFQSSNMPIHVHVNPCTQQVVTRIAVRR